MKGIMKIFAPLAALFALSSCGVLSVAGDEYFDATGERVVRLKPLRIEDGGWTYSFTFMTVADTTGNPYDDRIYMLELESNRPVSPSARMRIDLASEQTSLFFDSAQLKYSASRRKNTPTFPMGQYAVWNIRDKKIHAVQIDGSGWAFLASGTDAAKLEKYILRGVRTVERYIKKDKY